MIKNNIIKNIVYGALMVAYGALTIGVINGCNGEDQWKQWSGNVPSLPNKINLNYHNRVDHKLPNYELKILGEGVMVVEDYGEPGIDTVKFFSVPQTDLRRNLSNNDIEQIVDEAMQIVQNK